MRFRPGTRAGCRCSPVAMLACPSWTLPLRSLVVLRQAHDVAARLLVALERERPAVLTFLEQGIERAEAIVRLVEPGLAALQRLLDHRAPDLLVPAALGDERFERLGREFDRLLAPRFIALLRWRARLGGRRWPRRGLFRGTLLLPNQIVVVNEFVAVRDEKI